MCSLTVLGSCKVLAMKDSVSLLQSWLSVTEPILALVTVIQALIADHRMKILYFFLIKSK